MHEFVGHVPTPKEVREFYEKSPLLLGVVALLTLGSPFLGLVIAGWLGVLVGLVCGVASFVFGLKAITRVREK